MNSNLHSLLDDFFEELVNINPNTVNRVINRNPLSQNKLIENLSDCQALTPTSIKYKDVEISSKK